MRTSFLAFAITMSVTMLFHFVYAIRKKQQISKYVAGIHITAFFALISYIITLFTLNERIARLFYGLYFIGIDCLLMAFMDFVLVFTEEQFKRQPTKSIRTAAGIIAFLDTCAFIANAVSGNASQSPSFTLSQYSVNGHFISWLVSYRIGFIFHSVFDYSLAIWIAFILGKKAISAKPFYRNKFIALGALFLLVMFFNLSFMIFSATFRFSILMYSISVIGVTHLTFLIIPKEISAKIKLIIAENINNAVICFDISGKCIFMNRLAKEIFETEENCLKFYREYNALGKDFIKKREKLTKGGSTRTFIVFANRLRDSKDRKIGTYMKFEDITEEERQLEAEKYRATHDELTGLLNRRCFFKYAEDEIRQHPEIARFFICMNVRNFRLANDIFGEKFCNEFLKKIAATLTRITSCDTLLGRISGGKFAILIKKAEFEQNSFLSEIEKSQIETSTVKYRFDINMGIYDVNDPHESAASMFDKASLALKRIKDDYERSVEYYNEALMEQLIREKQIISRFDTAIAEGQFSMFLQPQVSSSTLKIVGAEALVRWYDTSEDVMIPPGEFVPVLEKTGFIYRLDKFIWEEAVKKLADWGGRGIDFYIAVNISAKDFYYLDIYKTFTELVTEYGVNPRMLKLEITETVLMQDFNMHSKILARLQEFGFCIEMDDFGSGYSSLNVLKNIKMDVLKIDMAFLKQTENVNKSTMILDSIVKMAKRLGMTIITEGVENEYQVDFLKRIGCDIFQGYFYSKPVSVAAFEEMYTEGTN